MLSLREHSRAELQRKLLFRLREPAGAAQEDHADDRGPELHQQLCQQVSRVLDELEAQGLLSDQRAAEALLVSKSPRYGARRLQQFLQAKSLDADLVSNALRQARHSEFDRALAIWSRRFGTPPADPRERARQQRFLAARGFEGEIIARVFRHALDSAKREHAPDDGSL